ncbi:Lactonase, 7-bladed beta-propeller-domain-containing protein [Triangularia verruculosa]|uniref:Lactonase, 7-bladed beta-propeller-domain-containing protein n=1 Tax=Triangularia verruculosa TaxID=2587418 RepID=A0AAN7ASQ2_9PEZI|nr:Lactonase, 7-bladed beta-propeller-domain-containing protein [Triangularia verruculosa]
MRASHGIITTLSASFSLTSAACSKPSFLYVSSYAGGITTYKLGSKGLEQVGSISQICGTNPSWQTLVGEDQYYCINENWDQGNGTFTSAKLNADGTLAFVGNSSTHGGPVHIALYGENGHGVATANYGSGTVDTLDISNPALPKVLQTEVFPVTPDNRTGQEQSRPHQGVLDPTGNFLVFPDLGWDLLRVYQVGSSSLQLTSKTAHELDRGTGPRHGVFLKTDSKTFFYVANELANTILGFEITYENDELSFSQVFNGTTHGNGEVPPSETRAGELILSHDNKFLIVSSRLGLTDTFTLSNGTTIKSDSLITFSIDQQSGKLAFVQKAPSGGNFPRHFTFNKAGTQVAVVSGVDQWITIFERDVATGKIGKSLATATLTSGPNHILWKE